MSLVKNRTDAGERLLILLAPYLDKEAILYALPRGGVPVAYTIAKATNLPLELLMVKKIGHPINSEYAIGAVTMDSQLIEIKEGIPDSYIDRETQNIRKALQERFEYFMGDAHPRPVQGKVAIIIDDGIATGNTMQAAVNMLKTKRPSQIIVATPVAPPEVIEELSAHAQVVYLHAPEPFGSVGKYYDEFPQLTNEEVKSLLQEVNKDKNGQ